MVSAGKKTAPVKVLRRADGDEGVRVGEGREDTDSTIKRKSQSVIEP